ncbi:MAG: helix-hairpin-helix domain-containing protein [Opitutaceae bacterium]
MHRLLITILFSLLSTSLVAANKEVGVWEVLEDCRLVKSDVNDGDSFLIQHGNESDVFRLYYVDAPETVDTYMDRVRDQARYFSIPTDDVITTGELASQFTKLFLRGTFTVFTKWEDARGSGKKRYYALIKKDGNYLSMELVKNGLVRIYGMPTEQAWPTGYTPRTYLSRLKNTERQAQRARTGIWAVAGSSQQMAGLESLTQNTEGNDSILTTQAPQSTSRGSSKTGMLNVNTASAAELETLPGIGPALAQAIIQARPIATIASLVDISGISDKKLAAFESLIIVAEPPPPAKTVEFYFADLEKYINTEVTMIIRSVTKSDSPSPESFRAVTLVTANAGEAGGSITAYIPDEFYDSFSKFYEEAGREFTGLLYDREGETVIVYQRK